MGGREYTGRMKRSALASSLRMDSGMLSGSSGCVTAVYAEEGTRGTAREDWNAMSVVSLLVIDFQRQHVRPRMQIECTTLVRPVNGNE